MSLIHDLKIIAFKITCQALGIDPATNPQNILPLNSQTNPGSLKKPDDNFVFYRVQFGDSPINRQIDTEINGSMQTTGSVTRIVKYIRNITFNWQTYGADGFENADKIRLKLLEPEVQEVLESNGITLVPDIAEPVYVPEIIGTEWFERNDLQADCNQLVEENTTFDTIASADVVIETEKGAVSECST